MSTYEYAAEKEVLTDSIDELTKETFYSDIEVDYELDLDEDQLKEAAWIGSYLANSEKDDHRTKALTFAVLLYVHKRESKAEPLYRRYLYIILTRLGNIPTAKAISKQYQDNDISIVDDGSLIDSEIEITNEYYRFDDEIIFTKFQKEIWNRLEEDCFVFSGPTSSGKSFLLQTYVENKISESNNFQGLYLVPSRALISEVSAKFQRELPENVDVRNGIKEGDFEPNQLLVLTPERCLQLFEYSEDDNLDLDLIFLDEIQELESSSRGPLFEDVMDNLLALWPNTQILAAGPNIENPKEVLEDILPVDAGEIKSLFKPSVRIEANMTFVKGRSSDIDLTLETPTGREISDELDRPTGLSYSTIGGTRKNAVKEFDENFGGDGQTLVYAPTTSSAESFAEGLSESREKEDVSSRCRQLIDFLSRNIHQEYTLAKTLENGVGFHHSGVPKVAREEVERLYKEEDIDALASTSTLLQGVNLPAEKMYIFDPSKGRNQMLSDHEFENLVGRVGRVGEKMYGTTFYVDRENEEWGEERMSSSASKEVQSATSSAIEQTDKLAKNIQAQTVNEIEDKGMRYTVALLRNKYVKDKPQFREYLSEKGVDQNIINKMDDGLQPVLGNLDIPSDILRKNPTVDPVLQNELYREVEQYVVDQQDENDNNPWEIYHSNLREDFFRVTRLLNGIFRFAPDPEVDINEVQNSELRSPKLVFALHQGYHWIDGKTYKEMIELRRESLNEKKVSTSVKGVMKTIRQDVQYLLVKYYRILCDVFQSFDDYDNKFMLNFDKRLERGSVDPNKLAMMDMGVDRSVVINLDPPDDAEPTAYLDTKKDSLNPIYQRHLQHVGVFQDEAGDGDQTE